MIEDPPLPTPQPVTIENPAPILVEVVAPVPPPEHGERRAAPVPQTVVESGTKTTKVIAGTVTTQAGHLVATPTSTEEEDRVSLGQRTVNLLWESTQRQIALSVIGSSLFVAVVVVVFGHVLAIPPDLITAAAVFLFGVANLVTGFYFGRTNHQKVGGVEQGR